MDEFEKYIRAHRQSFDDHQPDTERLWSNIEMKLRDVAVNRVPYWRNPGYQIAASFLLLLGIGVLSVGMLSYGLLDDRPNVSTSVNRQLSDLNLHYTATINHYRERLEHYPGLSATEKADFLEFLDKLDTEYEALEAELYKNINNEKVLQAIVQNQKIRIELINNFLQQMKKSTKVKENYESYSL
jgi:hypothetical protein